MKDQLYRVLFRPVWLMSLMALAFSVPALAQFEVAPDHFDSKPAAETKHSPQQQAIARPKAATALSKNTSRAKPVEGHHGAANRRTTSPAANDAWREETPAKSMATRQVAAK
jgi:hypothetical protein